MQLNELDEWKTVAYENLRIYTNKVKWYHDQNVKQNKKFEEEDQILLYNDCLHLFPGKLKSQSSGPYTVTHVLLQGVIEIHHSEKGQFKVNGHRLKPNFGKISIPPDDSGKITSFELPWISK